MAAKINREFETEQKNTELVYAIIKLAKNTNLKNGRCGNFFEKYQSKAPFCSNNL